MEYSIERWDRYEYSRIHVCIVADTFAELYRCSHCSKQVQDARISRDSDVTTLQTHIFIYLNRTRPFGNQLCHKYFSTLSYHSQLFGISLESDEPDSSGIFNARYWEQYHELCDADGIFADRLLFRNRSHWRNMQWHSIRRKLSTECVLSLDWWV
jgi:hypothetical protein